MIVSILQLMGFPLGKPVHSRAEESPPKKTRKAPSGTKAGTTDQGQLSAARRHEVKTQPAKSSKPEATSQHKAVAHAPAKPAAKTAPKPATKAPVVKVPEKPAAKVAAKTVSAKPAAAPSKAAIAPSKAGKPADKAAQSSKTPVSSNPRAAASPASMPATKASTKPVPIAQPGPSFASPKASYHPTEPANQIVAANPMATKKDPKLANNWKTKAPADLSDAELLAMPDAEYMNTVQLAVFRLKLTKLKSDILNSAGETTEHLREDTSVVPDPADRATIEEEHALELRTRDRERKLLKKIEQSIMRIDAGDYGYCDETGEPIGVGRLLARPTATLSLEAQQRRELKQKMFGD